jgi:hypothetical protein
MTDDKLERFVEAAVKTGQMWVSKDIHEELVNRYHQPGKEDKRFLGIEVRVCSYLPSSSAMVVNPMSWESLFGEFGVIKYL